VDGTLRAARRLDPEARREQIVAAAICYFAEVGLGGTTRDLAARIGITQALLYRYFASKAELAEAVFERVYLDRLNPRWINDIRDRKTPLEQRLSRFYRQYGAAIFTYEWMRIFMWAGLAGERLNQRYLTRVGEKLLMPLREEIAADPALREPTMEEMWALHGGVVYIGIRRFIYQLPTPDDDGPVIDRTVANFLRALRREAASSSRAAPRAAARSGRVSSRR
jgi:AcrR family transcriptional regulator